MTSTTVEWNGLDDIVFDAQVYFDLEEQVVGHAVDLRDGRRFDPCIMIDDFRAGFAESDWDDILQSFIAEWLDDRHDALNDDNATRLIETLSREGFTVDESSGSSSWSIRRGQIRVTFRQTQHGVFREVCCGGSSAKKPTS